MGRQRLSRKDLPRRMYHYHGAYYFISADGKRIRLGSDYGVAMRAYGEIAQPPIGRQTISAVMDVYIRDKLPLKAVRTQSDYHDAIRRLRAVFGAMQPQEIAPRDIYRYLRERHAKTKANREIAVMSNVMQQAIEIGLVDANPCRQVRRNPESPRTRDVTDAEVADFLPHCPNWLRRYTDLKCLTGLRQGDMLRLGLFSARDDGLFVLTGKRGKRLLFQWTPALRLAWDACVALRRKPSEARLFVITQSGFKSAWSRAMRAWIPDDTRKAERFAENDLRAKVASQAIDLGMDATSMLGHSSDAVTRRHYVRGTRKVSPLR
jgi:integrase